MDEIEEVTIEMQSEDLADFRQFIQQKGEGALEPQEIHQISPGLQREPIIIALVIALGGPVLVRQFVSLAKEWLRLRSKNKQVEIRLTARLLGGGKRKVTLKELEQFQRMSH